MSSPYTYPHRYVPKIQKRGDILAVLLLLIPIPAFAHSDGAMTYPLECCHNMDCAPVEKAVRSALYYGAGVTPPQTQTEVLVVTTRHGTAIVPPDMIRRESKDARSHACIRNGKILCYFLPPGF